MALSAQTGYILPQEYEMYYVDKTHKKTMKQYNKPRNS